MVLLLFISDRISFQQWKSNHCFRRVIQILQTCLSNIEMCDVSENMFYEIIVLVIIIISKIFTCVILFFCCKIHIIYVLSDNLKSKRGSRREACFEDFLLFLINQEKHWSMQAFVFVNAHMSVKFTLTSINFWDRHHFEFY